MGAARRHVSARQGQRSETSVETDAIRCRVRHVIRHAVVWGVRHLGLINGGRNGGPGQVQQVNMFRQGGQPRLRPPCTAVKDPIGTKHSSARTARYPYAYVFQGQKTVLVWHTRGRADGFVRAAGVTLLAAPSEAQLRGELGKDTRRVRWAEGAAMDFDRFWVAVRNLRVGRASSKATCKMLLDGWNFLEDLLRTTRSRAVAKRLRTPLLDTVYDKLFYGINLPAVTPKGRSYSPLWTRAELRTLRKEIGAVWQYLRERGVIVP
jgi:hypothetical protein